MTQQRDANTQDSPETQAPRSKFQEAVSLLEASGAGLLVVDCQAIIKYINPTLARWLGYTESELEDKYTIGVFMPSADLARHMDEYVPKVLTGKIPTRMMAGGRYVTMVGKMGTGIRVQIAYQNAVIEGTPYVVSMFMRESVWSKIWLRWVRSRQVATKLLIYLTSFLGFYSVVSTAVVEFQEYIPTPQPGNIQESGN